MGICFGNIEDHPNGGPIIGEMDIRRRFNSSQGPETFRVCSGIYKFACVSAAGCKKSGSVKENQDSYCALPFFCGNSEWSFFAVYDGHGTYGHLCSEFCRNNMPKILENELKKMVTSPKNALTETCLKTHAMLHTDKNVNDEDSGTTCIAMLIMGTHIYAANVGDSRGIMVNGDCGPENRETTEDRRRARLNSPIVTLSTDQDVYREDEKARVIGDGGKIMTSAGYEKAYGIRHRSVSTCPSESRSLDSNGPLRIWGNDSGGLSVTRSLGDSNLKDFGVIARPEIIEADVGGGDARIFLGSDGIFDVWSNEEIINDLEETTCPMKSCLNIKRNAKQEWVVTGNGKIDDMTALAVYYFNESEVQETTHRYPNGNEQ